MIARRQIAAVLGAPRTSRASTTNGAVSPLLFAKYCEKPPLFNSDSSAQTAEKTFCGWDCEEKSCLPKRVWSDPESVIKKPFLSILPPARLAHPIKLVYGLIHWAGYGFLPNSAVISCNLL